MHQPDTEIRTLLRSDFPESIHGISGFPEKLFYLGNREAILSPLVAIVGTRNPTPYGLRACAYFSRELTLRGLGVLSGLAVGIDAAAHRACLREQGTTVAVVAHGLDQLYPAQNQPLARAILEAGGAIVSEFEPGTPPRRYHFPMRNRILSALSLATLIVEASEKSGSLITGRHAAEQGREVFVVPGPFDCSSFRGSHALLRDGAKLVDNVEEVMEEIRALPFQRRAPPAVATACLSAADESEKQRWAECFERAGGKATLLDLVEISGCSLREVLARLEWAERTGLAECVGFQTWLWLAEVPRRSRESFR